MTDQEIAENFTHYALFAGFFPVYFNESTALLQERNWIPSLALTAAIELYGSFVSMMSMFNDDFQPGWMIELRGEIQR
jgi:hypothetical protein